MTTWINHYQKITLWFANSGMSLLVLLMRLWIAKIFWFSGLTKLSNWQGTLALFSQDYKVPLLSPEIAAYLAASLELTCPILFLLGFATRFAALALLGMCVVIEYTYPGYVEHFYWMFLLATILFYGAGKLSLDFWIKKEYL